MMISKCPKCEGMQFELVENSPANSRNKINVLQCSSCGSVVGMMEYFVNWEKLDVANKRINDLEVKLDHMTVLLNEIYQRVIK